jgi:hypothetical protein
MIDTQVSERVLEFARDAFADKIENLLDDPSWLLEPDENPARYFRHMRQLATDLGLDFDVLVDRGHEHERLRLRILEERFG